MEGTAAEFDEYIQRGEADKFKQRWAALQVAKMETEYMHGSTYAGTAAVHYSCTDDSFYVVLQGCAFLGITQPSSAKNIGRM